jgi:aminoglycoside phosphotransferase
VSIGTTTLNSDPALPQRDLLLDTTLVGQRLSRLIGPVSPTPIQRCERIKATYQVGRSLRLVYRAEVLGSTHTIAARVYPDQRSAKAYCDAAASAVACGPLRPIAHDPEINTVFWTFPNDRKLTQLPSLWVNPGELAQNFSRRWVSSRLMAYAPEWSATVQCLDQSGGVVGFAKVFGNADIARRYLLHDTLRRNLPAYNPNLRLPRVVAYSERHRTVLIEAVEGRPLPGLPAPDGVDNLRRLGAAVATLHSLPLPRASRFARFDPAGLHEAAHVIGRVRSDVESLAGALASLLVSRWEEPAEGSVCLHGDVSGGNAIIADGRVTLLDLEDVALGPAAADLGSVLARLRYYCRIGRLSASAERNLADAFLTGYASVRALPDTTARRWYTAAALFAEQALRAVTRIRPAGLLHLQELLAEARMLLCSAEA